MITYSKFRQALNEQQSLLEAFVVDECHVYITKDMKIIVDDEYVGDANSLDEARSYARKLIEYKSIVDNIDTTIPEEKVVNLIKKYHSIDKITHSLVESYIDLASSNIFSIDPVIVELNKNSSSLAGKFEFKLEDGSEVAINESTHTRLSELLEDKYQIVEYMRKSKANFMHVVKELR